MISGLAMETITETIITESTMIGHNPATPGGTGTRRRGHGGDRRRPRRPGGARRRGRAPGVGLRRRRRHAQRRRRQGRRPDGGDPRAATTRCWSPTGSPARSRWSTRSRRWRRCRWACCRPSRSPRPDARSGPCPTPTAWPPSSAWTPSRPGRSRRWPARSPATGRRWSCAPRPATSPTAASPSASSRCGGRRGPCGSTSTPAPRRSWTRWPARSRSSTPPASRAPTSAGCSRRSATR